MNILKLYEHDDNKIIVKNIIDTPPLLLLQQQSSSELIEIIEILKNCLDEINSYEDIDKLKQIFFKIVETKDVFPLDTTINSLIISSSGIWMWLGKDVFHKNIIIPSGIWHSWHYNKAFITSSGFERRIEGVHLEV